MYDWPEVRNVTDAWWQALASAFRDEGITDSPETLFRGNQDTEAWIDPGLLLSQTCGYPYTHGGATHLRLVATPCYGIDGCNGPNYQSFLLCRRDAPQTHIRDFRGSRAVINDTMSQSGYSALRAVIAPHAYGNAFFSEVIKSGGHRRSMALVGQDEADICAVDAVCYALARRYVPDLIAPLRIIAMSPEAPALPYVTTKRASDRLVAQLRAGIMQALNDPGLSEIRNALFISGAEFLVDTDYQRILDIEHGAENLGYRVVR